MRPEDMDTIKQMAEIIGLAVGAATDAERARINGLLSDVKFLLTDSNLADEGSRIENALLAIKHYERGRNETDTGPAVGNEFPNGYADL